MINYLNRILFTTLFLITCSGFAQKKVKDTTKTWDLVKYDFNASLRGVGNAFTQPLRWKKKDALTFAGIAAGSAILYSFDEQSADFFTQQAEDVPIGIREFGRYLGNPQNNYAISAGIYGIGLLTKNEKMRKTGVLLVASGFTVGLISSMAKTAIGRARPGTEFGKDVFKPFSKEGAFHSMPSGHAALVVTTAHVIAKQFESLGIKI
ncbi:MAG: phosphoesterase, partial [Flavobacteriaceae bacterium]